jgi:hypothetical protein
VLQVLPTWGSKGSVNLGVWEEGTDETLAHGASAEFEGH